MFLGKAADTYDDFDLAAEMQLYNQISESNATSNSQQPIDFETILESFDPPILFKCKFLLTEFHAVQSLKPLNV